ncbi:MAG: TIGR03987 family protein [Mogibacterium sp.]|nr:TIGR03987 family protein [Mogibacterium sp.]
MSPTLIKAVVAITLALVFYTLGVWMEHKEKMLRPLHLVFFWLGFCADSAGTGLMAGLSSGREGFLASLHGITGIIAIVLMLVHAIWATAVIVLKDKESAKTFHRYSTAVWRIWLIPFVLGMAFGMIH